MSTVLTPKVTIRELAKRWGPDWDERKLRRLVEARKIPFVKIGGGIYFELETLEQWLAQQRRGPSSTSSSARRARRSRADECAVLGIAPEHPFS